jgi:transcriptional regulator with XRE-family HTH domain
VSSKLNALASESKTLTKRAAKPGARRNISVGRQSIITKKRKAADPERDMHDIVSALGVRVHDFRSRAKLSLSELADQSGVSRAMLSKVERGEKSPTLSIISRIASGLNVSISELMGAAPDASAISLTPMSKRTIFIDPESGFERHLLSPTNIDRSIEFLLHRIPRGQSSGVLSNYNVPTEKYIVVVAGTLTVQIGENRHTVKRGDSFYFEIKAPYKLVNEGATLCEYYMVIVKHA